MHVLLLLKSLATNQSVPLILMNKHRPIFYSYYPFLLLRVFKKVRWMEQLFYTFYTWLWISTVPWLATRSCAYRLFFHFNFSNAVHPTMNLHPNYGWSFDTIKSEWTKRRWAEWDQSILESITRFCNCCIIFKLFLQSIGRLPVPQLPRLNWPGKVSPQRLRKWTIWTRTNFYLN